VDVYSFGVLCWEMMTGEQPWGRVTDPKEIVGTTSLMPRHTSHPTPHSSHVTPHTPRVNCRTSLIHMAQLHLVVSLQQRPPLPDKPPPSYPRAYVSMIERCWAHVRSCSHVLLLAFSRSRPVRTRRSGPPFPKLRRCCATCDLETEPENAKQNKARVTATLDPELKIYKLNFTDDRVLCNTAIGSPADDDLWFCDLN
jgi:hypothetical protein